MSEPSYCCSHSAAPLELLWLTDTDVSDARKLGGEIPIGLSGSSCFRTTNMQLRERRKQRVGGQLRGISFWKVWGRKEKRSACALDTVLCEEQRRDPGYHHLRVSWSMNGSEAGATRASSSSSAQSAAAALCSRGRAETRLGQISRPPKVTDVLSQGPSLKRWWEGAPGFGGWALICARNAHLSHHRQKKRK